MKNLIYIVSLSLFISACSNNGNYTSANSKTNTPDASRAISNQINSINKGIADRKVIIK